AKIAFIVGGVILALILAAPLLWGGQGYGYGMMGPWMMGGFGGTWFMPILMIVFWGLIIWGIVALVRGAGWAGCGSHSAPSDSALDVLKSRYARGEIGKEEFEEKKKDLI
ncbi:MAG: SHOCT domain-containing protein, partial [bacterium]|nr:SHOCT domain-containing protein [bacterium]